MDSDFVLLIEKLEIFLVRLKMTPKASRDLITLFKNTESLLVHLNKSNKINNRILIELEKYYRSSGLMIGLGNIELTQELKNAWREVDLLYTEQFQKELKLYGVGVGIGLY